MFGSVRLRGGVVIDDAELGWRFSRSQGPGGQGVNTADSRAELSWDVGRSPALDAVSRDRLLTNLGHRLVDGVLTIAASEHRSQLRNREAALARLVALVDDALRPPAPPRRPTAASRASRARRATAERQRRQVKSMRRRPTPRSAD
ncbi:alternative ribosome rescue aminoacyl-tRNA hydrolase ArfB [Cellulomonas sp. KRMCY2]|uniref:alternative ribosome rescue aminoacyl-tRNA hydrolase ArfB n=1 Tax=Cellulomonas sp. KRMCY2 TaxID=1304865 RepID=UPI001E2DA13E|nr:alternative ribosome rescue aminoacyl-tRNA hydrolase ArfB [Cellulomonas sp. KRMCY2]